LGEGACRAHIDDCLDDRGALADGLKYVRIDEEIVTQYLALVVKHIRYTGNYVGKVNQSVDIIVDNWFQHAGENDEIMPEKMSWKRNDVLSRLFVEQVLELAAP